MAKTLTEKLTLMKLIATEGFEHDTTRSRPARAFNRIIKLIEDIETEDLK